jgi:putative transcriptional regulator
MKSTYNSIRKGLEEAIAHAKGENVNVRLNTPLQIKSIREKLNMTQTEFAETFGLNLNTLKHWERGNRQPHGPALALLKIISKKPKMAMAAIRE